MPEARLARTRAAYLGTSIAESILDWNRPPAFTAGDPAMLFGYPVLIVEPSPKLPVRQQID